MTEGEFVMKTLLSTLLAGAVMFGATAASAEKLVIAGRDGAFAQALKIATEAFKAKNPGVEFETLELTGGGLLEKVTIAMREGSGAYDVIMVDDPWAPEFMSKGWLADLAPLGGVDPDHIAPTRDVSRFPVGTGAYYAVPMVGNVAMFAYNKAMFDKHGLKAPASWTEVLADAETISKAEKGVSGLVFRGMKGNPVVTGFLPILGAHGGQIVDAKGAAALNSKESLAALNMWLKLAKFAPKGVETYNATEVRDALGKGVTAMSTEIWPSWVPPLDDAKTSQVVGQIEVMTPPGETAGPAPMLGAWLVAIPESSKQKPLAKQFLDFLTSAEMQTELALKLGMPPTRASVYANADVVKAYRWYPAQAEALKNAKPRPRIAQWGKVEAILGDYLQLALIGEMKPEEALAEAHEKIAQALSL